MKILHSFATCFPIELDLFNTTHHVAFWDTLDNFISDYYDLKTFGYKKKVVTIKTIGDKYRYKYGRFEYLHETRLNKNIRLSDWRRNEYFKI
jgi:hypothetical protein